MTSLNRFSDLYLAPDLSGVLDIKELMAVLGDSESEIITSSRTVSPSSCIQAQFLQEPELLRLAEAYFEEIRKLFTYIQEMPVASDRATGTDPSLEPLAVTHKMANYLFAMPAAIFGVEVIDMAAVRRNPIDFDAMTHLRSMEAFLIQLRKRRNRRRGISDARYENKVIDHIITQFLHAFQAYTRLGTTLIHPLAEVETKAAAYQKLISNLEREIQFLSNLARIPIEMGEAQAGPSEWATSENHELVNLLLALLNSRVDRLIAIHLAASSEEPLAATQTVSLFLHEYSCVKFNYVQSASGAKSPTQFDVNVVTMPLYLLLAPNWDLSILWHEAVAVFVQRLKDEYKLTSWHQELMDDLSPNEAEAYAQMFAAAGGASQADLEQWLGEIIEDIFGVSVLGRTLVEIKAAKLMLAYGTLKKGDPSHPPGILRILTLLKLIDLIETHKPSNLPKGLGKSDENRKAQIDRLNVQFQLDETVAEVQADLPGAILDGLARKLAAFGYRKLVAPLSSPDDLLDWESEISTILEAEYRRYLENPSLLLENSGRSIFLSLHRLFDDPDKASLPMSRFEIDEAEIKRQVLDSRFYQALCKTSYDLLVHAREELSRVNANMRNGRRPASQAELEDTVCATLGGVIGAAIRQLHATEFSEIDFHGDTPLRPIPDPPPKKPANNTGTPAQ